MRLSDFLIYYMTSYYKKGRMDGLFWKGILRRSIFLATINIGFSFLIVGQVIFHFSLGRNAFDMRYILATIVILFLLLNLALTHIYIRKKRYESIISDDALKFKLSLTIGVAICFLWFVLAFLLNILTAIILSKI